MSNLYVVSSFGPGGWDQYAKKFAETFVEFWPEGVNLLLYYHDCERPAFENPRVTFKFLGEDKDRAAFLANITNVPEAAGNVNGQYNFRFDAVKFCNKVFAIVNAAEVASDAGADHLLWLDADTFTEEKVVVEELLTKNPCDIAYLGRTAINYAETSFIIFNLKSEKTSQFIRDFVALYVTGELLNYKEWHDGFLFSRLLELHKLHGLKTINLSIHCHDLDAFHKAPIGKFMTHLKGNKKLAQNPGMQPIRVKPRDCVPDESNIANIQANVAQIDEWVKHCLPHAGRAIIASAGPSLLDHIEEIRAAQQKGAFVMCVKHSYPILRDHAIVPDGCLVLDPRPFHEESTHGQKRSGLLTNADQRTIFFVATMTNPEYVPYLRERNVRILGWHAMSNAITKAGVPVEFAVSGGTCSAIRALAVMHAMGFRVFDIYGIDGSIKGPPSPAEMERKDPEGRPWWMEVSADPEGKHKFWSTGEMIALVQDVEQLAKTLPQLDSEVRFHSDHLAGLIWNRLVPGFPQRHNFEDMRL